MHWRYPKIPNQVEAFVRIQSYAGSESMRIRNQLDTRISIIPYMEASMTIQKICGKATASNRIVITRHYVQHICTSQYILYIAEPFTAGCIRRRHRHYFHIANPIRTTSMHYKLVLSWNSFSCHYSFCLNFTLNSI